MKEIPGVAASALVLCILSGCGGSKTASVWLGPGLDAHKPDVYVVLPFEDRNSAKHKTDYPEAVEVVRDAFETAFLETNHHVLERVKIQSVLSEWEFSLSGLTQDQGIEIGKMLNADAVILGTVKAYYKGSFMGAYTTVGMSARAVHVGSGAILWKVSHTRSTSFNYDYDPAALADDIAQEAVHGLIASGLVK